MRFGLTSTNTGRGATRDGAIASARLAEELGFESLWTVEHVVVPSGYQSEYPYDDSGKMAGGAETFNLTDPLIWLAFVAAATERIKLGTGVLILPQRNPVIEAKSIATIDVLSGGRMLLGVGVGWLREEYDAIGVPFGERGRRMDDCIATMRALWTSEKASVHNDHFSFDDCISRPSPVNGTVPIIVGGESDAAARRAGRLGDGYMPASRDLDHVAASIATMRRAAEEAGRDPEAIELTAGALTVRGDDELFAHIDELAALGITRIILFGRREDKLRAFAAALDERFGMTT
jgi:probable F420-dependent oxidoreductase